MDAGPSFIAWLSGSGFNPGSAAFAVLWQVLGLPSPLQLFEALFNLIFGGRPKLGPDSATDNVAVTLLSSRDPWVRAWGKGIRILERRGIPISTSNRNLWVQTYGELQQAILRDLKAQMPQVQGRLKFPRSGGSRHLVTAGERAWWAYQQVAYSRECNASTRDPECVKRIRAIDDFWYVPLVVQGGGGQQPGRACACAPPSKGV